MEQIIASAYTDHLNKVLKSYKNASMHSLNGPQNYVAGWGPGDPALTAEDMKKFLSASFKDKPVVDTRVSGDVDPSSRSPPIPVPQMPVFIPMDTTRSEKSETMLEGETITCFIVGGEKRLCLPQILNTVLRDFSLPQIYAVCDELHIFCSRCTPEQLELLKVTQILPGSAGSCGLITKTDAERLCNALLYKRSTETSKDPPSPSSIRVYHECFGKCKGFFNPELYTSPNAKCIECMDCHGLFAPQKFVCHSHKAQENRTCHWGFDSANWRYYLLLSKDQEFRERGQAALDRLKAKFDFVKNKRKQPAESGEYAKRGRYEEAWLEATYQQMSAFRPWSPTMLHALKEGKLVAALPPHLPRILPAYLHTGPPVLLNPERVVLHSDAENHDSQFAPNVSLAPASHQKVKIKEEPEEDEECDKLASQQLQVDVDSSDTEESSQNSATSTPRGSWSEECTENQAALANLLEKVLEGQVSEVRHGVMEEFEKVQRSYELMKHSLERTNRKLQQELEYEKSEKLAAADRRLLAQEELDELRREHDLVKQQLRQAESENKREMRELKHHHKQELDRLMSQLRDSQAGRAKLQEDVRLLQQQLNRSSSSSQQQASADCDRKTSPMPPVVACI